MGYYNRCKNLLFTARYICTSLDGIFPKDYEGLLLLKGVGPYTAAAIASFAYNLPHAVVDGNVFRVFARYFGIHAPIDTKEGLRIFNAIAFQNLAKKQAGSYNQALMDFGATVCKPMSPLCSQCPMNVSCVAFTENKVGQLPLKSKSIQKKKRYFDFLCFVVGDTWFIQERQAGDIWAGLYQFYLIENEKATPFLEKNIKELLFNQLLINKELDKIELAKQVFMQQLTHQTLSIRFATIYLKAIPSALANGKWVKRTAIASFPFPKTINEFLLQTTT